MNRQGYPNPDPYGNIKRYADNIRRDSDPVIPPEAMRVFGWSVPGLGSITGHASFGKARYAQAHDIEKRYRGKAARRVGDIRRNIRKREA